MSFIQAPAKNGCFCFASSSGAFLLEVNLDEHFIKSVPLA